MTTTDVTTKTVEDAARALLDHRIAAVRDLAITRQARNDKRAELEDAERADAAAYAAAQRVGWTTDELRKVGLDEPDRKAPGRPRRTRANARPVAAPAPADNGDADGNGGNDRPSSA